LAKKLISSRHQGRTRMVWPWLVHVSYPTEYKDAANRDPGRGRRYKIIHESGFFYIFDLATESS